MHPVPAPRSVPTPPGADLPAVAVSQASLGFLLGALGPCLILLARDLEVPRTGLAWVSAGFGAGLLLLGLLGERLLSLGAWRLLRISAAGLALGALLLGCARAVLPAQAGALLLGVGGAGIVLVTPVLVTGRDAAKRLAVLVGLSSLTGIGAPLLISAADAASGLGRSALLLTVPPLAWVALRGRPAPGPRVPPPGPAADFAPGVARRVARWWLAIVCSVSPEFTFVVWGAARLEDSGLGPAGASAAAATFPIGMAAGRFLAPRLLDRIPLVAWGVGLAVAGALLAAAPVGPAAVMAAGLLAGLGIAPLYPVLLDRLVRTPGLDPRRAAAVGALASGTAVLLAPLLLSALARVVTLRLGFLAVPPLLLLVLLLYRRGRAGPRSPRAASQSPAAISTAPAQPAGPSRSPRSAVPSTAAVSGSASVSVTTVGTPRPRSPHPYSE